MVISAKALNSLIHALGNSSGKEVRDLLDNIVDLSDTELGYIDAVTAGTAAASKALVLDSNSELDGLGVIKVADVAIAAADFYGMNGTPQELVAAPGAGVALEFLGAYVFIDYSTADFDFGAGEDLVIRYTNGSGNVVSNSVDSAVLNTSDDLLTNLVPVSGASGTPTAVEMTPNAALVAHILSGDGTAGGSTVKIRTYYREVRIAAMEAIS